MIPAGVQVYVASTPVDFRKGAMGLMALVRDGGADPFSGALYVFRRFGGTAVGYACLRTTYIHTTPLSASVEGFSTIAILSAAARSTRRFHRLHRLRGGFVSGTELVPVV
jgi:hypothetical protein